MQTVTTNGAQANNPTAWDEMFKRHEQFYNSEAMLPDIRPNSPGNKMANSKKDETFFANTTVFRGAQMLHVTGSGGVTLVVTHKDCKPGMWTEKNHTRVTVQTWKENKMIKEHFFNGNQ